MNSPASRDITFVRPPSEQSYGTVAVFEDLYGNRWDLVQCDELDDRSPADDQSADGNPANRSSPSAGTPIAAK